MIFAQHDARPDASPVVSQTSRLPAAANPANVALLLPVCFLLVSVCSTSLTNFSLFSYRLYTPALEMGAAGALLLALGILRHLRQMQPAGVNRAMITAGSAISLLSKPEFALAACAALLAFVFVG